MESIPFDDNVADEIICDNYVEHIPVDKIIWFFEEMWRVCKDGAIVKIITAHGSGWQMYHDPTHVRGFSYKSFEFFEPTHRNNYYTHARFKVIKAKLIYASSKTRRFWYGWIKLMNWLANKKPFFCERIWSRWVGGFDALYVEMRVIK